MPQTPGNSIETLCRGHPSPNVDFIPQERQDCNKNTIFIKHFIHAHINGIVFVYNIKIIYIYIGSRVREMYSVIIIYYNITIIHTKWQFSNNRVFCLAYVVDGVLPVDLESQLTSCTSDSSRSLSWATNI